MASNNKTTKTASKRTREAVSEYRAAKLAQDAANARVDAARTRVLVAFAGQGQPDVFTDKTGRKLITRTEVTRTSLDAETVKRYAPKTYERALRTSTFPRLTLGR